MDLSNISLLIYSLLVLQLQIAFVAPKIVPRNDLQLVNINQNLVEYRDKVVHSLRPFSRWSDLYDGKKRSKTPPKTRPKLYKTRSKRSSDGEYQPYLAELPNQVTRNEKVKGAVEGRWSHHTELHTERRSISPRIVTKLPQIFPKTSQSPVLNENKRSIKTRIDTGINSNVINEKLNTPTDGKNGQGAILYLNIPSKGSDNLLQRIEKLFETSEVRTSLKSVKSFAKKNRMRVGGLILVNDQRTNLKEDFTSTIFPLIYRKAKFPTALVNTSSQSKENTTDRDVELQYKVDGGQTLISVGTERVVEFYDTSIATTTDTEDAVENDTFVSPAGESEISDEEYEMDGIDDIQEVLKNYGEDDNEEVNTTINELTEPITPSVATQTGTTEDVIELQCQIENANTLISVSSERKLVKISACTPDFPKGNGIAIVTTTTQRTTDKVNLTTVKSVQSQKTAIEDLIVTTTPSIPTKIPEDVKMQHVFDSKHQIIWISGESEVVKVNPTTTKSVSSHEEADFVEENDFFILNETNTSKNNNGIEKTTSSSKPCTKYIITNNAEVCADKIQNIATRRNEERKKEAIHSGNHQLLIRRILESTIRKDSSLEIDEDQPVRNVSSLPDQNDVVYPSSHNSKNISQEAKVDSMDHSVASEDIAKNLLVYDFDTLFEQGESMKQEPIKTVNRWESLGIASHFFTTNQDKVPEKSLKANFNRLHEKSISAESKSQTIQKENLIEFSESKNQIDYSPVKEQSDSSKSNDMDIIETNVKEPEMNLGGRKPLRKIGEKLDLFSTDHDDLARNLNNRYRRVEVISVAPPNRQMGKQAENSLRPPNSAIGALNANSVHIWTDWQDEDDEPLNLREIPKIICERIASGRLVKPNKKNDSKSRKVTKTHTPTQKKKNKRD